MHPYMIVFSIDTYQTRYLSARDTRDHYGVTQSTLTRWVLKGSIRCVRPYYGGTAMYDVNSRDLTIKQMLLIDRHEGKAGVSEEASMAYLSGAIPDRWVHWKRREKLAGSEKAAFGYSPKAKAPAEVVMP
jgi:hypothetical protein